MNTTEHLVVTGATGFIGRHLAFRLLDEPAARITLLVRGESQEQARSRVLGCLREVARDLDRPFDEAHAARALTVVVGDLTRPSCDVDASEIQALGGSEHVEFWHVAATLCFEENKAQRIHDQNVTGTLNAIELARELGAERFVYVSTAYSCGDARGEIAEALHPTSGPFNNEYERSKCLAEQLVRECCGKWGMAYSIVRPSIVVGLSGSYAPSGSDSGLYGFARELHRMRRALVGRSVRLVVDRDAPLNFIAIDVLVNEMLALRAADFAGGPVYHLTSVGCPTVGETMDAICDGLGLPRFELVSRFDSEPSPLEALLERRTVFYGSYLRSAKTFARSVPSASALDRQDIERYVERFLDQRTQPKEVAPAPAPAPARPLAARDGFPLLVAGPARVTRETVVLVNAMGLPREALAKLELALAARYDVLTWQSRGVPSLEGTLDGESARFARHVEDLEDLLAAHGVERAHLVGWCAGVDVALEFARRSPKRVLSLSCLNGPFLGLSRARTPYQANLLRIVRAAAKSEASAALYHGLIAELVSGPPAADRPPSEERQVMAEALSVLDPEVMHLTAAPLRSPTSFHRYCVLLSHYLADAPRTAPSARIPALVVSAEDDPIAHCDASRDAAELLGAELQVHANGGHFLPCKSERVIADVLAFIARVPRPRSASRQLAPRAERAVQYSE